jgi:hypothetical protein
VCACRVRVLLQRHLLIDALHFCLEECESCSGSLAQFWKTMEAVVGQGESAKLSRERRGLLDQKPRELKPTPYVANMLLELRGLKTQSVDFFIKRRGLYGSGLNPKLASDMSCITPEKIEEIWGKCVAFKTTNTTLNPEIRKELLQLYFKIYGKMEVTNKEFMTWVVKGYIAEQMGFEVD